MMDAGTLCSRSSARGGGGGAGGAKEELMHHSPLFHMQTKLMHACLKAIHKIQRLLFVEELF